MKTRIMHIERKGNEISGPARIGRMTFSKSSKSLYYKGRRFHTLAGSRFKSNYFDAETGISGHRNVSMSSGYVHPSEDSVSPQSRTGPYRRPLGQNSLIPI
jgi:hypothetical protein